MQVALMQESMRSHVVGDIMMLGKGEAYEVGLQELKS